MRPTRQARSHSLMLAAFHSGSCAIIVVAMPQRSMQPIPMNLFMKAILLLLPLFSQQYTGHYNERADRRVYEIESSVRGFIVSWWISSRPEHGCRRTAARRCTAAGGEGSDRYRNPRGHCGGSEMETRLAGNRQRRRYCRPGRDRRVVRPGTAQ